MANAAFEELVDTFEFLDDWEDRYRHVIDMGKALPDLDVVFKTDATKVDGCASQVWLRAQVTGAGEDAVISFDGDSDAMIVKGLIAVLHTLYNGETAGSIVKTDAIEALGRLGLNDHLSAQRSNGVRAMVQRLRDIAAAA